VSKREKSKELVRLIEEAIKKGATTGEEITRAILDLPVKALEGIELDDSAQDVKKIGDHTIGSVYKLVRNINQKVADLAVDLLEMERDKAAKSSRPKKASRPKRASRTDET
jgi:hypothetical protein